MDDCSNLTTKTRQRSKLFEILDLLLSRSSEILGKHVLTAVDNGKFAGFFRILENRKSTLNFDTHVRYR